MARLLLSVGRRSYPNPSFTESPMAAFIESRPARSLHVSIPVWTSHFDTHLFVQRLEKHGMTRHQAEGVMTVLAEVVDESVKGMEASLVSKAEQEKVGFQQKDTSDE